MKDKYFHKPHVQVLNAYVKYLFDSRRSISFFGEQDKWLE